VVVAVGVSVVVVVDLDVDGLSSCALSARHRHYLSVAAQAETCGPILVR
jgi:hypothetical protein